MPNIQSLLDTYIPESGPGLACVVIKNGQVIFTTAKGYANTDSKINISPATTFRLASVSKQFVAAGILTLIQDGVISLDVTLDKFFPDFPNYGHSISIKHLLTHSSGLIDYETLLPPNYASHISDEEILLLLKDQTTNYFKPGEKYKYSNSGYCLLHLIIEQVTGQSLGLFLTERIFVPADMDSAFVHTAGMPDTKDMALGHSLVDNTYKINNHDATSWTIGDGGIYASITDLAAWSAIFHRPHKLGEYDLSSMFIPYIMTDEPNNSAYGFGVFITQSGETAIYHEGETVGSRSCVYYAPETDLYIALLCNRDDINPLQVCMEVQNCFKN